MSKPPAGTRRTVTGWAADKARKKIRDITYPHHCDSCNRSFRKVRGPLGLNAHHYGVHVQRWTSAKARKAARLMGKDVDKARRMARGAWEAAGLLDGPLDRPARLTAKARSRPVVRGKVKLRDMRQLHKHDKHHERAAHLDHKATKSRRPRRQARLKRKAEGLRGRWPASRRAPSAAARLQQQRQQTGWRPAPARPAPTARTAPPGTRPVPARSVPAARLAATRSGRSTR